ncbi:MAG: hypothetical protein WDN66_02685 [Candidatus Saccharibacteria bacterium]
MSNEQLFREIDVAEAFVEFGAEGWIDQHIVVNDGVLDIEATAEHLGVPVYYENPKDDDGNEELAYGVTLGLGDEAGIVRSRLYLELSNAKVELVQCMLSPLA